MQSWDEMREAYLEWMRIRNYSLKTVNNNEKKLKIFVVWALERGLNSPSEITKAILERYQRYLYNYRKTGSKHGVKSKDDNKPLSVHTQMGYLSALRSFFRWAARQNLLLYNPASEIDLPRPEKRLPKHILNEKEVEQILSLCDIKTHLGLRDRAIIETLY